MLLKSKTRKEQITENKKINKIEADGNGNIVLQDINDSSITVNYNDIETLKTLFQNLTENQIFEIKQIIGNDNKEVLLELRKIQNRLDEQKTEKKAETILTALDDFFKDITQMKMEGA